MMFDRIGGARFVAPLLGFVFPLLLPLLLSGCGGPPPSAAENPWKQIALTGPTMGTSYHIKAVVSSDREIDATALQVSIDSELARFNKIFSTYDPESEISRFNAHRSTEPFAVSNETVVVARESRVLFDQSEGAFDPTVGPLVDLWGFGPKGGRTEPPTSAEIEEAKARVGYDRIVINDNSLVKSDPLIEVNYSAIAKGYGVDLIAGVLDGAGFTDYMVEIGGEIVVRGKNLQRRPWTIGIDSPDQRSEGPRTLVETMALTDCAVATSGDYRNAFEWEGVLYSHLIDPHTGWPIPESVKSVTVIAPNCMLADGAATAIAAMGAEKGLAWAGSRKDLEVLVFVGNHEKGFERMETSGMKRFFLDKTGGEAVPSAVGGNE